MFAATIRTAARASSKPPPHAPRAEPAPEAAAVATSELLALHMDQKAGRAAPFPEVVRDRLAALVEAAAPAWAGRSIAHVA